MFWSENPYIKVAFLFIIGILVSYFLSFQTIVYGFLLSSSLILYSIISRFTITKTEYRIVSQILFYITILFFGCFWNSFYSNRSFQNSQIQTSTETKIILTINEILNQDYNIKIIATQEGFYDSLQNFVPTYYPIIASFKKSDSTAINYKIGSTIIVFGFPKVIQSATNPDIFDYKEFLRTKGIFHQLSIKEGNHSLLSKESINPLRRSILFIKTYCESQIHKWISHDQSRYVAEALVLGNKTMISDEVFTDFANTGAIHVLSVSGMHVAIFISLFVFIFNLITPNQLIAQIFKTIVLIMIVWFYVLLTGESPSVVRAGAMVTIYLIGKQFFKNTSSFNILSIAAILMLLYNPLYLFQISFQFSYLSLLSILYFHPKISAFYITENKVLNKLWQIISVSLAAQILIFPLTIYHFHKFPLYFALSGLIAAPIVFLIIYSCTILLIISIFLGNYVILFGNGLDYIIQFLLLSISFISDLPFALLDNMWISNIELVLFFVFFIFMLAKIEWKRPKYTYYSLLILSIIVCIQFTSHYRSSKQSLLFIYDIYPKPIIDIFEGKERLTVKDSVITAKSESFVCAPTRIKFHINAEKSISHDSTQFLTWNSGSIFIADSRLMQKRATIIIMSEYLLINKGAYNDPKKILNFVQPKTVILSKNINEVARRNWYQYADSANIVLHDIKIKGAYIREVD